MATVIRTPPRPRPTSSIAVGSSYWVTSQWMTFLNPLTLISEETQVPFSIVDGILPRHPPKIVIQSPNRPRSDASFHADSGERSDVVETSTRATFSRSLLTSKFGHTRAAHTLKRQQNKPSSARSDARPGLVELLGHIDDLRRLRLRRVDLVVDILRDEAANLRVHAADDTHQFTADALRRHVHRDVGRPRLGDVDNQQ